MNLEIISDCKIPFRKKDKLFFKAGKRYCAVESKVADYMIQSGFAIEIKKCIGDFVYA